MKVSMNVKKEVNITKISLTAHCRDCFAFTLYDDKGDEVFENDGYVPDFLPGSDGDSIELDIDMDTGKILNWDLCVNKLQEYLDERDE